MNELIKQVEILRNSIKAKEREIDNPVFIMSILIAIDDFVANVQGWVDNNYALRKRAMVDKSNQCSKV